MGEALARAIQLHQSGDLQTAERCYREILDREPHNVDALHLLGVIAHQVGQNEVAVDLIRRAIVLSPQAPAMHCNLGSAYRALGKLDEAAESYQVALRLKPDYAEVHSNLGTVLKGQGKLDEAIACYQRSLQIQPRQAEAHNNLAIALKELGRVDQAIASYRRAIQLKPHYAEAHCNLGTALYHGGRWQEAVNSFQQALLHKPSYAEAHCYLGAVLHQLGRLDEAVACLEQALQLRPDYAEAHSNLGGALHKKGALQAAIDAYQRALQLKPEHAETHNNLGSVLQEQGRLDEAASAYQRALQLRSRFAEAHNNLGSTRQEQGRLHEAVDCYQRAIEINPKLAEAHGNLGSAWKALGSLDEAISCYERALQYKPDHAETLNNLGLALQEKGRLDEAIASYQRALYLKPDSAEAHCNLGNVFEILGKLDQAVLCFEQALRIKPDFAGAFAQLVHQKQQMCDWEDLDHYVAKITAEVSQQRGRYSPGLMLTIPAAPELQYAAARQWAAEIERQMQHGDHFEFSRQQKERLTIGYLSADLRDHAVANLAVELFARHDRQRYQINAYSYGPDDRSPMRERLSKIFDRFVDIRAWSHEQAARAIYEDGVDVLIDLTGYTGRPRTEIMAMRPAPIQVNYLGYPGTMGADFIDYILVDPFVVPMEQQPFFAESLVHLTGSYQVNDSGRPVAERIPSRTEAGLPEEGFVFCCFNQSYKITPPVFAIWMRLLQQVPQSVLWLMKLNRFAAANLRREAESRGVDPQRLIFAAKEPLPNHLARTRNADLFLDTWPYNAHVTASDALWVGCPVLTFAGNTFASRVAGSLLATLGVTELITESAEDYEQLALRLVRQPDELRQLRDRLVEARDRSSLFDGARFASRLEQAFERMWQVYLDGRPPSSFAVHGEP